MHAFALIHLHADSLLREQRPPVAQDELRVRRRAVEALRELGDERRGRGLVDGDAERNLRVGRCGRRFVDGRLHCGLRAEEIGSHENASPAEPELHRCVERLLDGFRGVVRRQPTDADAADRDSRGDRARVFVRADRAGRAQQGQRRRNDEDDALQVFRLPKIRGSLVMIPSAPASISRFAVWTSSTVHTYTAAPNSCARAIAAGDATE